MLRFTARRCGFEKSHSDLPLLNIRRRWLYLKLGAAATLAGFAALGFQYHRAGSAADDTSRLASPLLTEVLEMLPLNSAYAALGSGANCTYLDAATHQRIIRAYIRVFGVDVSDCEKPIEEYATLQEFFERKPRAQSRPVQDVNASLVSPCDGLVLRCEALEGDAQSYVQVKGLSYSLRNFLRLDLGAVPAGHRRVAVTLSMRLRDYHRVQSPCVFTPVESVFVAGTLLPTTFKGIRWVGNLFVLNERVIVRGFRTSSKARKNSTAKNGSAVVAPPSLAVAMALVGGTCTGNVHLSFDPRVKTNQSSSPEYSVLRKYNGTLVLQPGSDVGYFSMGSAVVLIADVPTDAQLVAKAGDVVKIGEVLVN